jgi:hypothetical protein
MGQIELLRSINVILLACPVAILPATSSVYTDRATSIHYGSTYDETATLQREMRQPGDVYVIMGSGPVNRVIAPARLHG